MADSSLAARLQEVASKDDIEVKPALRLLMNAMADLIHTVDRSITTQTKDTAATNVEVALVKALSVATQRELDSYKNRVIGIAIGVGFFSGSVGTVLLKIIIP